MRETADVLRLQLIGQQVRNPPDAGAIPGSLVPEPRLIDSLRAHDKDPWMFTRHLMEVLRYLKLGAGAIRAERVGGGFSMCWTTATRSQPPESTRS